MYRNDAGQLTRMVRRIGLAVFFFVASSTVSAVAVPVGGLDGVIRQLKGVVGMPVLLPTSVPNSLTATMIYARVLSASPHQYRVQLASTRSCTNSRWCLLGTVAARRGRTPSALGRSVRLVNGTEAYYNAPVLSWKRQSVWYQLRLPGVTLYSSEVVAASFRTF